ncbi:MAG: TetR/AcrR family transcriptional regulator [Actinomycetota bacterium]|nr:TetR/AcrR family transcriptional regulator [Actinomycetota bacterium]
MNVSVEPRERVLAATYACVARFGMGKTTVEDVVKESGVSRASIYRLFPGGKDQLLRETVGWEMNRFFASLAEAVYDAPDFATLLERGLVFAHRAIQEHVVLRKVLETEPERLLPLITVEQHRVLEFITAFLLPYLEREERADRVRPGVDLHAGADYVARMILSLIGSPGRWDMDDPEQVRVLVREELLGGILV